MADLPTHCSSRDNDLKEKWWKVLLCSRRKSHCRSMDEILIAHRLDSERPSTLFAWGRHYLELSKQHLSQSVFFTVDRAKNVHIRSQATLRYDSGAVWFLCSSPDAFLLLLGLLQSFPIQNRCSKTLFSALILCIPESVKNLQF